MVVVEVAVDAEVAVEAVHLAEAEVNNRAEVVAEEVVGLKVVTKVAEVAATEAKGDQQMHQDMKYNSSTRSQGH